MFSMPNAYLSLPGRLVFRQILIALILICAIGNGVAVAQNTNETAEVQRLLRDGQLEQTLQRAYTFLA